MKSKTSLVIGFTSNFLTLLTFTFSDLDSDSDDELDLMSRRRSSAVSTQIKGRFGTNNHSNGVISEEEEEPEQQDRDQQEIQSYV